jgi:excisionase family DNA binding protein
MEPQKEGEGQMVSAIVAPRLLRLKEVARLLDVSPRRVRELVATGELPSVRLGEQGWHRFRAEDIERLLAGEERAP